MSVPQKTWNIGNTIYFHTYVPTRFDGINNPWYRGNVCPFYRMNPLPPSYPPYLYGSAPLVGIPNNPALGTFGTSEITLKGYVKENSCQFGYFPANINGQGACCDVFGTCGIGDTRLT
jgi:hypothetical protein